MGWLNEADGKNSHRCERCKKVWAWYNFPFKGAYKFRVCFRCLERGVTVQLRKLGNMATENNMTGLRDKLFDTIDDIKNKSITVQEAKTICEVAQVIINSVKVEVEYMKAIGGKKVGAFLELQND